MNEQTSTNDNGAFAYQPLRGNFDVIYMPDFEEQYVVSSKAGLGNAVFKVNLGQGWSLQGFNSLTDNSELNRRIFHLIDTAMRMAQSAGTGALGLPPLPDLPPPAGTSMVPKAQAGGLADKEAKAGTPVSLKIVVVHYAAKGVYPVIKPRELQERKQADNAQYFMAWDLFHLLPRPTAGSEFDPRAIVKAQGVEATSGYFTVPRYPYQYVSFNTFRFMAIEVITGQTSEKSPFEHLYDKTGTKGEVGASRTGEIVDVLKSLQEFFWRPGQGGTGGSEPKNGTENVRENSEPELSEADKIRLRQLLVPTDATKRVKLKDDPNATAAIEFTVISASFKSGTADNELEVGLEPPAPPSGSAALPGNSVDEKKLKDEIAKKADGLLKNTMGKTFAESPIKTIHIKDDDKAPLKDLWK